VSGTGQEGSVVGKLKEAVPEGLVSLADAVDAVREQIVKAQAKVLQATADEVVFQVGQVTVEFTGTVTTTGGVSGKAGFWVFAAEASAQRSHADSVRVSMQLMPQNLDGTSPRISDQMLGLPQG